MKQNLHPTYYPQARAKCACGHTFEVGSTKPELEVEICSFCHPFYTGKEKLVDTAGRVERFKRLVTRKKELTLKKAQLPASKRREKKL